MKSGISFQCLLNRLTHLVEDISPSISGAANPVEQGRLPLSELALKAGEVRSVSDMTQVQCVEGILWITEEGNSQDILLTAGESHAFNSCGLNLIQALGPARIILHGWPSS